MSTPRRKAEWRGDKALPKWERWPAVLAPGVGSLREHCGYPGSAGFRGSPTRLPQPRGRARLPKRPGRHGGRPTPPCPPLFGTHRRGPRTPVPGPHSMAPGRPPVRPSVPRRRGSASYSCTSAAAAAAAPPRAEVSLAPAAFPEVTCRQEASPEARGAGAWGWSLDLGTGRRRDRTWGRSSA